MKGLIRFLEGNKEKKQSIKIQDLTIYCYNGGVE